MFGIRLKELRKEKSINQKELATLLKVSASTIGMYEQGRRDPDTNTLKFLADYFDVSTDYLLGRTDERDVYVIKGDMVPKELREEGIEEIGILKEFKDSGLTKEEIKEIIEFAKKMKKQP